MAETGEQPKSSSSEKLTGTNLLADIKPPTEATLRSGLEEMGKIFIAHSWRLHIGESENNPEARIRLEERTSYEAHNLEILGQGAFVKKVREAISKRRYSPSDK